jgi:hypothetical protein
VGWGERGMTRPSQPYRPQSVRNTPELQRVLALPRRRLVDQPSLAAELTEVLRTPTGTMRLRDVQGQALQEIGTQGGLFGPIGVGEGKTLITLLAAYILDARRPLLLLPAGLIEKTNRERAKLAAHWRIPTNLRLMSYEILGRVQSAGELEVIAPDLIIGDEIHKLKNRRAAVTRRIARWMHEHPETRFVGLSGTIMRKSLTDFAHILRWCLKDNAPVPRTVEETEEWALALDEQVSDEARFDPGALLRFTTPDDGDEPTTAARRGFQRRLLETPGVVSATQGERVDCSIYVRAKRYEMSQVTAAHVLKLRTDMVTPDDWELMTGAEVWMHARQLALGFHSIWDPRPPEPWRRARKAWNRYVRDVLSRSRTLDSPDHVARAIDDGRMPEGKAVLDAWRAVRDTFRPNVVAVWHDDSALRVCADWMRTPGVVWTEHVPFAERLAEMTGAQYFGAKGLTARGESIEDERVLDARRPIIASIDANREGRNLLTRWNRMLFVSPPAGSDEWQQAMARLHRPGQQADEVEVDVFLGCVEHADAFRKALTGAAVVRDTMGEEQRLLLADISWPSDDEIASYRGPMWGEKAPRGAKAA